MEDTEIFIGREVEKGNYLIDNNYVSIGRKHARMIRKPDGVYIEDLNSANGTFVNGQPVNMKKINTTDKITLGGTDYYDLDLAKALKLLPLSDTEFHSKIMDLKQVYDVFQNESNRLQSKGQESMMLRILPTMLLGSLTGIFTTVLPEDYKITILVAGIILTVAVFFIALKIASRSSRKTKEKLNLLNEQFELDYVCPACGASFKGKTWEFIKRTGKCYVCQRNF